MSNNSKMQEQQKHQEQNQEEERQQNILDQSMGLENLDEIESEIEISSAYFKPKANKKFVIRMNPYLDKIVPVVNERFKDAAGKPIKRYECKITHPNNSKEQIWAVPKTVCLQIISELKKGFTVLSVKRTGEDRTTTYSINGVQ